jgi:DNA polymerase III delta prime subunit
VDGGDIPHLLFYGPSGAGKRTRVMAVLRELYGSSVDKVGVSGHLKLMQTIEPTFFVGEN